MAAKPDESDVYRNWTRLFVALIVAGCLVGIAVPAGLGWDFANFYDAGRRVVAGQIGDLYNPDGLIAGQLPQGTTGFFGTPVSALLYVPLGGFSPETALILFKIQNVLAFGATFAILLAFYRRLVPKDDLAQSQFAAAFAFLFLIYQPFWTIFRVGGQTTPTVLLLLTLGLVWHTRARFWASAACVVVAALIKPAVAPALIFLVVVSGLAFAWRLATVLAAAGLASLLLMGWPIHAAFLDLLRRTSGIHYAWYFNSSIYVPIDSFRPQGQAALVGATGPILSAAMYAVRGLILVILARLVLISRRDAWQRAARRHLAFTLAVVFFLMWSPIVWEHYLSMLFLPLIYVVAMRRHFSRSALVVVGATFALSVGQNLILVNWLRDHVAFSSWPGLLGIAIFKSAPLWLTLLLLWRHAGELSRSYAAWEN